MKEAIPERIIIAANFTIESITDSLKGLLAEAWQDAELVFAPYNQIFQQLMDPNSLFHTNRLGANIVFIRLEDLVETRGADKIFVKGKLGDITAIAADLTELLSSAERFSVPLFVFLCPPSAQLLSDPDIASEFGAIETILRERVSNIANLYAFDTSHMVTRYRLGSIDNPRANVLGHIPYTSEFMSALAIETVRKIDALRRKPFKVFVLDCDNTLWDGVVGEDGVEGIGFSDKRIFLQEFAVAQSDSGMVVCLSSKNNESDVWEVFDHRNEVILKKEHIVSSRINWLPKSQNLRSISEELDLGLESFVFVDDDPAVCSEVERNCPEVFTVLLPSETDDYRLFFDHLWVFDKLKVTQEDRNRTQSYRDQAVRRELEAKAGDMTEFLASLELVCEISELTVQDLPRASQLTLRTNQFNSTTIRRSESDIRKEISEARKKVWTVRVRDRFGDYGLVGVVVFEEVRNLLSVDSLILSCRVLGRGVEYEILRELGKKAIHANREFVSIEFVPTLKNVPALNFLSEVGERYEDRADGRMTFRIPAGAAIDCGPRAGQAAERPKLSSVNRDPDVETRGFEAGRLRFYSKIAHSLSNGGGLKLNGASSELSRKHLSSEFRGAITDTERELIQIWQRLLHATNIGVADDFFEIGGDSLIAVALFVEIEERYGQSLPLTSLIDAPTIEKLALIIDLKHIAKGWRYLVPLQPKGNNLPLFCMHAAGGNVLFYRDLAHELGDCQPVYGLQARGVADKSETAHDRIEEMAADYLVEIRQLQPRGPYQLCGSSFGGLVAFEAAKQLLGAGEKVSLLAVFDTYAPGYLRGNGLKPVMSSRLRRLVEQVRNTEIQLRKIETRRKQLAFVLERIRRLKNRQQRRLLWKKNEFAIMYNKATGREMPNDMQRNHKAIREAEDAYHPRPIDGNLLLIRATEQPGDVEFEPFLGWRAYIQGEIVLEEVKGMHGAIAVYPSSIELATRLQCYLNKMSVSSAANC